MEKDMETDMEKVPVMVITLKPSKAVMAKWKYSFQEIAAVVLNRLLLRKKRT